MFGFVNIAIVWFVDHPLRCMYPDGIPFLRNCPLRRSTAYCVLNFAHSIQNCSDMQCNIIFSMASLQFFLFTAHLCKQYSCIISQEQILRKLAENGTSSNLLQWACRWDKRGDISLLYVFLSLTIHFSNWDFALDWLPTKPTKVLCIQCTTCWSSLNVQKGRKVRVCIRNLNGQSHEAFDPQWFAYQFSFGPDYYPKISANLVQISQIL
jgi:hypothetical protein